VTVSSPTESGSHKTENRVDLNRDWTQSAARAILVIDDAALIRRVVQVALSGQLCRLLATRL
jgi:hypothetical protein